MAENDLKRPAFGNRTLVDESSVFKHNAWDNVEWTKDQEEAAKSIVQEQAKKALPEEEQVSYLREASSYWNKFYEKHDNKFFKDRHWLFTEFPELLCTHEIHHRLNTKPITENKTVSHQRYFNDTKCDTNFVDYQKYPGCDAELHFLEVGCGVGNTIFPVLQVNQHSNFFMYGCDYSNTAVDIVKSHRNYDDARCHAFVHDISNNAQPFPFPDESLDIVIMIFVLSALEFSKVRSVVKRIARLLKPGGLILFRDYGRYDMAQLRFKEGRCLSENFYTRGDGTLVYFFTQDEVRDIFIDAGLVEKQNLVDRRLQVNRAKQIKMYRVWIQAKYQKLM